MFLGAHSVVFGLIALFLCVYDFFFAWYLFATLPWRTGGLAQSPYREEVKGPPPGWLGLSPLPHPRPRLCAFICSLQRLSLASSLPSSESSLASVHSGHRILLDFSGLPLHPCFLQHLFCSPSMRARNWGWSSERGSWSPKLCSFSWDLINTLYQNPIFKIVSITSAHGRMSSEFWLFSSSLDTLAKNATRRDLLTLLNLPG